jgi:hypothetical protein
VNTHGIWFMTVNAVTEMLTAMSLAGNDVQTMLSTRPTEPNPPIQEGKTMPKRLIQAAMVATLATVLSSAAAQPADNATPSVDTRDDNRDFDEWGLLGLLGLLGLWPRKRRDVYVDDTRTTSPR